jgi:hypothetical protein
MYFKIWSAKKDDGDNSILETDCRNAKMSFCIIEAQSVKNTDAEEKGYDTGKKISSYSS